ncbi:MAG: hypothetical protein VX265_10355 [Myxococcota bacterium]|nr:hypothetical protein [Myxococcota bacterium]
MTQSAELSPWAVLLGLALLFAGGAWLWTLAVRQGLPGVPRRLERLPSAGLFGAGSAPLSQGLQAWEVDPGHAAALLGPLLATLARDHRVLLAAPERSPIPPVTGGPVYRAVDARPGDLGQLVARLADAPGLPVVVLMLGRGRDAADLRQSQVSMPAHTGGIVLLTETARTALHTAQISPTDTGWRLVTDLGAVDLVTQDGRLIRAPG